MNLHQMLELPREERSRYLCMMPLSSEYSYSAMEEEAMTRVRQTIHESGGKWREVYYPSGVTFQATFPSQWRKRNCDEALIRMMNETIREYYAEHYPELPEEEWSDELYNLNWIHSCVPALAYEQEFRFAGAPCERRVYPRPFGLELKLDGTWKRAPQPQVIVEQE